MRAFSKVYLETSVILRRLFGQSGSLAFWGEWDLAVTSNLTRIESLRTIDRMRLEKCMDDEEVAVYAQGLRMTLSYLGEVELNSQILRRASQAFPTVVSTLDAFHLCSALLWQEETADDLVFLTHDIQLARAVEAVGIRVAGV